MDVREPNSIQIMNLAAELVRFLQEKKLLEDDAVISSALKVAAMVYDQSVENHMKAAMIANVFKQK